MPKRRRHNPSPPSFTDPHHPRHHLKVIDEGELLVTARGDVILDVPLKRSRALLVRSEEAVSVAFKPDEHCPPCAGAAPDELGWEVVELRRELFLKIWWRVSSARTIIWKVFEVD